MRTKRSCASANFQTRSNFPKNPTETLSAQLNTADRHRHRVVVPRKNHSFLFRGILYGEYLISVDCGAKIKKKQLEIFLLVRNNSNRGNNPDKKRAQDSKDLQGKLKNIERRIFTAQIFRARNLSTPQQKDP